MSITAEEVSQHPFTQSVIRRYANKLIRNGVAEKQDRETLVQEIRLRFLQRWCKFDSDFGHHKSFVCTVVNRCCSNISREIQAQRKGSKAVSLSCMVSLPCGGKTELAQTIGEDELDRRLERKRRLSRTEHLSLAHDLAMVLASLTPEQRQLIELLRSQTMAQITVALGIARSTLVSRLAVIRERMREANLQEYLNS